MNAFLRDAQTADGGTVKIIFGFSECSVDQIATKQAATPLLLKTPEYARLQNAQAKIQAQNKIAEESWVLAEKAHMAGDAKNEAVHTSAFKAARSAVSAIEDGELMPLVKEFEAARTRLYMENKQYFPCGPGQCCCEEGKYEALKAKFDNLKEHERLTADGDVIPDFAGVEYWLKNNGIWVKEKIEFVGEPLPAKAVLSDKLTPEMQAEISEQQSAESIAAMSPEDREKAKQSALDALADEADRLERRAKIQRRSFDSQKYYDKQAEEIEKKYA
jgi:hypothetical protein